MPIERIIGKTYNLIKKKRVEPLGDGARSVVGTKKRQIGRHALFMS